MKDLSQTIQEAANKAITEKLPELVEKQMEAVIKRVVENLFSTYGDFSDKIKEAISSKLDLNLEKFDLIDYNGLILNTIDKELTKSINQGTIQPLTEAIQRITGKIEEKNWKMSEIFNKALEIVRGNHYETSGEFTFLLVEDNTHDWIHLYFDEDEGVEPSHCGTEVLFTKNSGEWGILILKTKTSWIRQRGRVDAKRLMTADDFQHFIFRLYSAKVKIEMDDLNFDTYWSNEDEY